MGDEVFAPRASRFREHTNTTSSIHPPPDELWKDIGVESLMENFNKENQAPAKLTRPTARRSYSAISTPVRKVSGTPAHTPGDGAATAKRASNVSAPPVTPTANEGALGRFSRAFASVFGGLTGKRKTAHANIALDAEAREKERLDERKRVAEAAYFEAKELGLLPAAKVFVRPSMAARMRKDGDPTATPQPSYTPRTPTLYHSQSKRDLYKQKKLSKRVSNLESKLATAKKELESVLAVNPPGSATTPVASHLWSEDDASPNCHTLRSSMSKKRKANSFDEAETPLPVNVQKTETRSPKRAKSVRKVRRQSSRLSRKNSALLEEEVIIVVPDGAAVPPLPSLPKTVDMKKVAAIPVEEVKVVASLKETKKPVVASHAQQQKKKVAAVSTDDGYGGLEHEMF